MRLSKSRTYVIKLYIPGNISRIKWMLETKFRVKEMFMTIESAFISNDDEYGIVDGCIITLIGNPDTFIDAIEMKEIARNLMFDLITATYQRSAFMVTPEETERMTVG